MDKTNAKRQQLTEKLADHLLDKGMQASSLRQMAAGVGTSDRMLLHYFQDKQALMTATLLLISERFIVLLNSVPPQQRPVHELVRSCAEMLHDARVSPYMRLWLEIMALVAGGEASYRPIATQISDSFLAWIAASLHVEREEERASLAALASVVLDGIVLMHALGSETLVANALKGLEAGHAGESTM